MRGPTQPFEIAEVAKGSVGTFGGLQEFQILPRNTYAQVLQRGYNITVALALNPQTVQLLAAQGAKMTSLTPNPRPPKTQLWLDVSIDALRENGLIDLQPRAVRDPMIDRCH